MNHVAQVAVDQTDLAAVVRQSRKGRVVVTRRGKPVALIVNVQGMDSEQLELGSNPDFWKLIAKRRKQKTITRSVLEKRLKQ